MSSCGAPDRGLWGRVSAYVFMGSAPSTRGRPGLDPARPLSVRCPGVPRAADGRPTDRAPSAAQRDRLDPAARAPHTLRFRSRCSREGWSLQIDRATWPFLYAWPIAVAYVFPNGHLLSPRWRWVALWRRVLGRFPRGRAARSGAVLRRRRVGAEPARGQRGRRWIGTRGSWIWICSGSGSSPASSPARSQSGYAFAARPASSGCRRCGSPGRRR